MRVLTKTVRAMFRGVMCARRPRLARRGTSRSSLIRRPAQRQGWVCRCDCALDRFWSWSYAPAACANGPPTSRAGYGPNI